MALLSEYHRLSPRVENEVDALVKAGHSFTVFHWVRPDLVAIDTASSKAGPSVERRFVFHRAPRATYRLVLYLPLLYVKLWRALREQTFDVIHFTHIMFLPFAVLWARTHGAKSVYDAYEFHVADFAMKRRYRLLGLPKMLELVEDRLVSRVDGVLTVDSTGEKLETRYRTHNRNVAALFNVPRLDAEMEAEPGDGSSAPPDSDRTVVCVGGLSRIKGADKALQAMSLVRREVPHAKLVMIGSFRDNSESECREYVRRQQLEKDIEFIPWLPYSEMMVLLRRSSVGLACYQPIRKYWLAAKGNGRKFFTYMQASLPIVGPEFGEIGQVVREEGCGILCDTTSPDEIAKVIVYLLRHPEEARAMGRRGRAAIEQKYNMSVEEEKLLQVYGRLGLKARQRG